MLMRSMLVMMLVLLSNIAIAGFKHIRPVPSLPSEFDPIKINDIFSMNLASQIHKSLFILDQNNMPMPYIVKRFQVSNDQKVYTFTINDMKFHNGATLSIDDIKYTIERVISEKSQGHEKFENLLRIEKSKVKNEFVIRLKKPTPSLIYSLADTRFSILKKGLSPKVGLGDYQLTTVAKDKIVISCFESSCKNSIPETIQYEEASKEVAVKKFIDGYYNDLLFYQLTPEDITKLKTHGKVANIYSPITYMFAMNSRNFPELSERESILSTINIKVIISNCYQGNSPSFNLVPKGFIGHIPNNQKVESKTFPVTLKGATPLRIVLAQGVGSETCVSSALKTAFDNAKINTTIEVKDVGDAIPAWNNNQIDLFFFYLESEMTLDFFQYFNPKSDFNIGLRNDTKIINLLNKFNSTPPVEEKHQIAVEMTIHILGNWTILPLFHPIKYLVYSNRYLDIDAGIKSPTFINFNEFEIAK